MKRKLILRCAPESGDTFTVDGKVFTFSVDEKEETVTIEVEAEEVSETLTDASSYWETPKTVFDHETE